MSAALSPTTIAIVKATAAALQLHGLAITQHMYERLFRTPEIRDLFNQSHHGDNGSQPKALAGAIIAFAQNIENLAALAPAVERIAQKHVGLQILPEHYPFVADALLGAIKDVLGAAATDEIMAAWGEAYWFLAEILQDREGMLYQRLADVEGGWTGWRDFRVESRVRESDVITSFNLRPVDGRPVMAHEPGQYLTFWLRIPDSAAVKRNYSISCAPNHEGYRISVKREPQGAASNWLHDHAQEGAVLQVGAPAGDFVLDQQSTRPVLLVSGGVGLTPMLSMMEALASQDSSRPVHYIHGTLNGATHAFGAHIREIASQHRNVHVATFYEAPRASDIAGQHYDHAGRIGIEWLGTQVSHDEADIYLCGPRPFLRAFVTGLCRAGVAAERIHYEFFGPADELLAS